MGHFYEQSSTCRCCHYAQHQAPSAPTPTAQFANYRAPSNYTHPLIKCKVMRRGQDTCTVPSFFAAAEQDSRQPNQKLPVSTPLRLFCGKKKEQPQGIWRVHLPCGHHGVSLSFRQCSRTSTPWLPLSLAIVQLQQTIQNIRTSNGENAKVMSQCAAVKP